MDDGYIDDELDPSLLAMMEEIPQSTALLNIDSIQIQGLSEHIDGANEAMGELEQITNDEKVKLEETATEPAADAENDKNKSNKVPTEKEEGEDKEGSFFNKRVKHLADEMVAISDAERMYEMTMQNPVTKNLFVWLKRMKLRRFRPERIRNDLANGYVVAEILSRFFPAQISTHSFDLAIHTKAKLDNWKQLKKFFRKHSQFGEILKDRDIKVLCDPTVGITGNDSGIHVLLDVYRFLFKCELVPKLSNWGQGEGKLPMRNHQANYASLIANIKEGRNAGSKNKSTSAQKEKLVQLSAAEQARLDEMHTFMGYRLTLDLLEKLAEAIQKMPGMSPKSSSMAAKVHVNVSKIFNVFDVDMTKDIDLEEFIKVIRKDLKISKKKMSTENLKAIFEHIDKDKSKAVTLQEFASFSREAQKAQKSGALDEEMRKRKREKAKGKDLTKGKTALLEEKAEKINIRRQVNNKAGPKEGKGSRSKSPSNSPPKRGDKRSTPKAKGRHQEMIPGRNKSPSPTNAPSPPPPAKPELTTEELKAVQARNQAMQQRRRTTRLMARGEGPPPIAPLPVLTRKDNIPGHGDRRVSRLVADGFMPESPKRAGKKSLAVEQFFGKAAGKEKGTKKVSDGRDNGPNKAHQNGNNACNVKRKKENKKKAEERTVAAKPTKPKKEKKQEPKGKAMDKGKKKNEATRAGAKVVPTKPTAPKPPKIMSSPRGKSIKEATVEVILKKPPKKGRIIKKAAVSGKGRSKEKAAPGRREGAGEVEQEEMGAGRETEQQMQQQQMQQQQMQQQMQLPYQYKQYGNPVPNGELLHNPSTIIEEGESISSSHTTKQQQHQQHQQHQQQHQQQQAGDDNEVIGMNLELIQKQNQEAVEQQQIQLQQGFYGQPGYGMQVPMDSYHQQQMMYPQQNFYGQERQQSQQSAVSSNASSQAQNWVQQKGYAQQMPQQQQQQQPVMQPQMVPPQMYQQQYGADYPGFPPFDIYDGGQSAMIPGQRYAHAGGPFVAGVPVLHVLKTPRDPTQRLSGVDINSGRGEQRINMQPSSSPVL